MLPSERESRVKAGLVRPPFWSPTLADRRGQLSGEAPKCSMSIRFEARSVSRIHLERQRINEFSPVGRLAGWLAGCCCSSSKLNSKSSCSPKLANCWARKLSCFRSRSLEVAADDSNRLPFGGGRSKGGVHKLIVCKTSSAHASFANCLNYAAAAASIFFSAVEKLLCLAHETRRSRVDFRAPRLALRNRWTFLAPQQTLSPAD